MSKMNLFTTFYQISFLQYTFQPFTFISSIDREYTFIYKFFCFGSDVIMSIKLTFITTPMCILRKNAK